jgi:hypothetical protein
VALNRYSICIPPNHDKGVEMRRTLTAGLAVFAIAALAWASSDPWKKPYQQWDQKDIQKILQDSPWSKIVRVDASWEGSSNADMPQPSSSPQMPPPSNSGGGGSASSGSRPGMGSPQQPSSGGGETAPSAPSQGAPQAAFAVRWLSSRTLREALVRSAVLSGQMQDAQAQKDLAQNPQVYEIVIVGPQMTPFQTSSEDQVKANSSLTLKKSKEKLQPVKVEFQKSPDGQTLRDVIIAFPKEANGQPTIGQDEKGAQFSVTLGRTSIKTSFDFSKMDDAQGRDL